MKNLKWKIFKAKLWSRITRKHWLSCFVDASGRPDPDGKCNCGLGGKR